MVGEERVRRVREGWAERLGGVYICIYIYVCVCVYVCMYVCKY
jgi:hypothetical protein